MIESQVRAYMALLRTSTLLQQAVDRNLREETGLTQAQFEILGRLGQAPDGMRMTDLARGLILSRSGATYRIQQLATAGYVVRSDDPNDDRGVLVHLTPQGEAVLARALPGHEALVQELMFDQLSAAQVDQLTVALESVAETIDGTTD